MINNEQIENFISDKAYEIDCDRSFGAYYNKNRRLEELDEMRDFLKEFVEYVNKSDDFTKKDNNESK